MLLCFLFFYTHNSYQFPHYPHQQIAGSKPVLLFCDFFRLLCFLGFSFHDENDFCDTDLFLFKLLFTLHTTRCCYSSVSYGLNARYSLVAMLSVLEWCGWDKRIGSTRYKPPLFCAVKYILVFFLVSFRDSRF